MHLPVFPLEVLLLLLDWIPLETAWLEENVSFLGTPTAAHDHSLDLSMFSPVHLQAVPIDQR